MTAEWISVSERIPEDENELVLALVDDDEFYDYRLVRGWVFHDDKSGVIEYWMPMPPPPWSDEEEGK